MQLTYAADLSFLLTGLVLDLCHQYQTSKLMCGELLTVLMHAGQTVRRNAAGYLPVTYSSVMTVSSDNDGDTYRCIMKFSRPTVTSSNASVDSPQPSFNFTWVSSPPLAVHGKYIFTYVSQ